MPKGIYKHKKGQGGRKGRSGVWKRKGKPKQLTFLHKRCPSDIAEYVKEYRHRTGRSKRYGSGNGRHKGWAEEKKPYTSNGKEYSADWREIRKIIYARDNWTCQECNKKCHGNGTKDKIQCHHIDYNEKNNNPDNLITLCAGCHIKTLFKREDWIKHFEGKVKK